MWSVRECSKEKRDNLMLGSKIETFPLIQRGIYFINVSSIKSQDNYTSTISQSPISIGDNYRRCIGAGLGCWPGCYYMFVQAIYASHKSVHTYLLLSLINVVFSPGPQAQSAASHFLTRSHLINSQ